MPQALDAAIRAGCDAQDCCNYPDCQSRFGECRAHKRQSTKTLRAALPAEPSDDYVEEYSRRRLPAVWRAIDEGMANVSSRQEIIREARKDVLALRALLLGETHD